MTALQAGGSHATGRNVVYMYVAVHARCRIRERIICLRLGREYYFCSPNSYHMAFNTPNAKAKESPRIQLKYHMQHS